MQLDDVVSSIPTLAVDAVCVSRHSEPDGAYRIVWANDAFCRMFATTQADALGRDALKLFHWDYVADFHSALQEMKTSGRSDMSHDTLCLRCDESSFWGGVSFVEIGTGAGEDGYALTFVRDIDDLKNREQSAELALIENEHLLSKIEAVQTRMMSAISISPDPFAIFDARDRLVIWNPAFAANASDDADDLQAGMTKRQITELSLKNGFLDDALGREGEYLERYMSDWRSSDMPPFVMRIRGRDYKVIRSSAPNGDSVILRVDISEQLRQQRELSTYAERLEQANLEISEQALQDELTGLGNRRFLNSRLEELVETRKKRAIEIAALHIDLDRFKHINDTMGHAAGDHVLQTVAEILRSRVRSRDIVARIGGDEFIILMICNPDDDVPEILADRLIEEICKPIMFEERPCRLGASIGIARTPMIPAEDLLTCSDIALYKAKTGGRAMKAVFNTIDLENLRSSKLLADDVLRGLENNEFIPFYQPQINTETGKIAAIEVLARWNHPERGLLPPGEFLGTALDIQVDGKLDKMVFEIAVSECRRYFADRTDMPSLSFNVSRSRLMEDGLVSQIGNLDYPGPITFELVETIFLEEESNSVFERITDLRALDVAFEVDDFGSGRASIVSLRRIGPDRLKIDRRLVAPITTSESSRRLVQSIVEIGRALEIGVTAEGVETEGHVHVLQGLGCHRMQGYHFARPKPLGDLLSMQTQSGFKRA